MLDARTRVFDYNGKKLVSILGEETFPGERVYKLPPNVIAHASGQPLTSALLPCRLGFSPWARGQNVCRPDGDWAFTLLYCLEGKGVLELPQRPATVLTRGDFAVLRPFEFHAYHADAEDPWSYYWIHFNGTMAQPYYDLLTASGKHPVTRVEPDGRFVFSFERMLEIFGQGHSDRMLVRNAAVMHMLIGDLYDQVSQRATPPLSTKNRIDRLAQTMRENPGMNISVQELAATANMSPAYFTQQFRRHLGDSPRRFANRQRMQKACEHLQSSDAKILSVASLVGCDDVGYFCRLFKRLIGQTPSDFRQLMMARHESVAGGRPAQTEPPADRRACA